MAHPSQQAFVASVVNRFPDAFDVARALDVGSLDINGDNRDWFENGNRVLGCDVVPGKNVDIVMAAHLLPFREGFFDTIISTEALEHDLHWQATLRNCYRMLASGGLLVLTCAGPGRQEHGTRRTSPSDAPGLPWPDYYMNLDAASIAYAFLQVAGDMDGLFFSFEFSRCDNPSDTYFWGIKR